MGETPMLPVIQNTRLKFRRMYMMNGLYRDDG